MSKYNDLMSQALKKVTNFDEPLHTRKGFFTWILSGSIVFFFAIYGIKQLVDIPQYIYCYIYFVILFTYIVIHFYYRVYKFRIQLSRKVNIVFAYNLEGLNLRKFHKKYARLLKSFRNEINYANLGNKIRIFECPPDINLKEYSAAEAMVKHGLKGSTILIWGHVINDNGFKKFKTKISFEFGYPNVLEKRLARDFFLKYIEKIISKGLLSTTKIDIKDFNEQLLPTVFFVLGVTTFSLNLFENSEIFFKKFLEKFKESNALRRKDLASAFLETEDFLVNLYLIRIDSYRFQFEKKKNEIKEDSEKILSIDKKNYFGNISLAYYFEQVGDRDSALMYNTIAKENSPKKLHLHLFNEAYFALHRQDYKEAFDIYKKIPDVTETYIVGVCENLHSVYLSTKDSVFLFAEGYLNFRWYDRNIGIKLMKKYIKKACKLKNHDVLVIEVEKILNIKINLK